MNFEDILKDSPWENGQDGDISWKSCKGVHDGITFIEFITDSEEILGFRPIKKSKIRGYVAPFYRDNLDERIEHCVNSYRNYAEANFVHIMRCSGGGFCVGVHADESIPWQWRKKPVGVG